MSRLGGADGSFIVAYGAAHGAKSLIWHASELLFAFFLTETIGLPVSYVGLVLAVSMLGNAAMDLTLGWFIRNLVNNSVTAARMQAFGALSCGISLVAFASTGSALPALQLGFATASMVLFRLAYPLLDNPQNAMLAFSTVDDGGRARVASVRYIAGGAAKLALAALFAPMMIGVGSAEQASRFWWLASVLALLATVTAVFLYRQVCSHPDVRIATTGKGGEPAMQKPPRVHIAPFAVFAAALILSATTPVFSGLLTYFSAFAIRDVSQSTMILSAVAIGSLVGQFGWSRLAQVTSLLLVLRAALSVAVVGALLFYYCWTQSGIVASLCVAIYGIGSGGVLMAMWSLLAGVASGPYSRFSGTAAFGLYTCCSKIGKAMSFGLIGVILAASDYRSQTVAGEALVTWMVAAPIIGLMLVAVLSVRLADWQAARVRAFDVVGAAMRLTFGPAKP